MSLKKGISAEKKYRSKTGGGLVVADERNFSIANDKRPFDTPAEEKLWTFFDNTPVTTPYLEGESSVGKRKSPAFEENRVQEDAQPVMDDFEFDTDVEEEGHPEERGRVAQHKQRITEADLLQEQYQVIEQVIDEKFYE